MPPVVWAIEAVDELEGALFWYAQKSEALSQRFANAVERTTDEVARMPMRFAELFPGKRHARVPNFPYDLIFSVDQERILVLACFHGKRNPKHWQPRVL